MCSVHEILIFAHTNDRDGVWEHEDIVTDTSKDVPFAYRAVVRRWVDEPWILLGQHLINSCKMSYHGKVELSSIDIPAANETIFIRWENQHWFNANESNACWIIVLHSWWRQFFLFLLLWSWLSSFTTVRIWAPIAPIFFIWTHDNSWFLWFTIMSAVSEFHQLNVTWSIKGHGFWYRFLSHIPDTKLFICWCWYHSCAINASGRVKR